MGEPIEGELVRMEVMLGKMPEQARVDLERLDLRAASLDECLRAAEIAEAGGWTAQAVRACNRALEHDPACVPALERLVELRRDQGDLTRAVELLGRLAAAGRPEVAGERIGLLIALDKREQAERELDSARRAGRLSEAQLARLEAMLGRAAAAAEPDPEAPGDRNAQRNPSDGELLELCERFRGRRGVHARQWRGPDGRCGYSPVRAPVTAHLMRQHLLGALTLGVYPVRQDNQCRFLVLDVDIAPEQRRGHAGGRPPRYEALLGDCLAAARKLAAALGRLGLETLVCDSGGKGHHVWVLFAEFWPARDARRLALGVLASCRPLPATVAVDVFPAQDKVAPTGLGNLVKLPLGIHRKTSRRALPLDDQGRPLADPLAAVCTAPLAAAETLAAALAQVEAFAAEEAARPAAGPAAVEAPAAEDEPAAPWGRAEPLPTRPPYDLDQDQELDFLLQRCAALRRVAELARAGQALTHDEQAALIYTIGHLARGPEAVNALLCAAGHEPALVSRLRGHPTGCRKLRARLTLEPERDDCDCRFDATLGRYPNPLLHLAALAAERELEQAEPVASAEAGRASSDERALKLAREIDRLRAMQRKLTPAAAGQTGAAGRDESGGAGGDGAAGGRDGSRAADGAGATGQDEPAAGSVAVIPFPGSGRRSGGGGD